MSNLPEPDEDDNQMYMEIVASLMNMLGKDEIFIPEKHFQNGEYEVWRKFEYSDAKGLRVKLVKPRAE
jgi:hypothetical protein